MPKISNGRNFAAGETQKYLAGNTAHVSFQAHASLTVNYAKLVAKLRSTGRQVAKLITN